MRPLIKWAGGKSNEIKMIKQIIPTSYDRYIEPFLGGGAVFFYLEPKKSIINDITKELMLFYKFLKNGNHRIEFKRELENYVTYWERIDTYMKHFSDSLIILYNNYKVDKISDKEFIKSIKDVFENKIVPFNGLFSNEFCIDRDDLLNKIQSNLISKLMRIKNNVDRQNKFSDESIKDNIETAFRSGFYTHFRDIMNKAKKGMITISDEKRIANYYFIREFCYGGMFRFNESGDFNIPYGGMNYNHKDFRKKVINIFSNKVSKLLDNAIIENIDFEEIFKKYEITDKDFVFLDPPYDTEFSEYEENPFTKEDHKRLAKCILDLKAKFILIIKETPFIRELYDNESFKKKGIKILSFGKTYIYNVRGRNVRKVRHLIIHNLKGYEQKLLS